tara:strand:- start:400 stop:1014 length:615 start_codon:yes stop_codon:yes gene_type:complete
MPNGSKNLNSFFSKNLFLGSYNNIENIPKSILPEFCFLGRSNVGKSSLINAITKNKNLSKTSKTPGRTQSINLFEINKNLYFVDLPGYGYAKLSKKIRIDLFNLIKSYIYKRIDINKVFILIDCNIGIKNSDIDMLDYICSNDKSFSIILTKIDKCTINFINEQKKSISSLMNNYKKKFDKIIPCSSKKNEGILDIQKYIYNLC